MRKLMIFILLAVNFIACYEDKGNYDYQPINEIKISGIETEYSSLKWENLHIEPQLDFTLGEETDLSYCWEVDGFKVSEEKNLDYKVDVEITDKPYLCRLTVKDNSNNASFFQEFKLKVITPYEEGLLLLSEQENKAMLSFKSVDAEEFSHWVYKNDHDEYLEGKPVSLDQNWEDVFCATSKACYRLDQKLMKLTQKYDGSNMLEKDPDFEMKFFIAYDMTNRNEFGCAIGTNNRVYPFRLENDYFSVPSPMPIANGAAEGEFIEYELSTHCVVHTGSWGSPRAFLGYDNNLGQFLYFRTDWNHMPDDQDQYNSVTPREPVIGVPILAVGMYTSGRYCSFFYDPETGKAKAVASHSYSFYKVAPDAVVDIPEHHFTPSTIMQMCDATSRAIYTSGSKIYYINVADVTGPHKLLSDKLPANAKITCMELSMDRSKIFVGVDSESSAEFRGDLYILDASTGDILKTYKSAGGKIIDVMEKY